MMKSADVRFTLLTDFGGGYGFISSFNMELKEDMEMFSRVFIDTMRECADSDSVVSL